MRARPSRQARAEGAAVSRLNVYKLDVQFGDCDPAGIVFFPISAALPPPHVDTRDGTLLCEGPKCAPSLSTTG